MKVLDCTLRDGGYYNDWDFDPQLVRETVEPLVKAGVDCVELGYRTFPRTDTGGLCKFCPESQLSFVKEYADDVEFGVMVDAKSLLGSDGMPLDGALSHIFRPAEESILSFVRIASGYDHVDGALALSADLKAMGYRTTINLMRASTLAADVFADVIKRIEEGDTDILYLADSFGSLSPERVAWMMRQLRDGFSGAIGFHAHDNLGLAYANSMAALEEGVDYIDATLMGMGRGAGNARLEQLLLSLSESMHDSRYDPIALLDLIDTRYRKLHDEYQWGWSYSYMLAGLKNIHPTYCQNLHSSHQYTMPQVFKILSEIPDKSRRSFKPEVMQAACDSVFHSLSESASDRVQVSRSMPDYQGRKVLIVANGPAVKRYDEAVHSLASSGSYAVLQCNHVPALDGVDRSIVVLNEVRLGEIWPHLSDEKITRIHSGPERVPPRYLDPRMQSLPFTLGRVALPTASDEPLSIPHFDVGMFASMMALNAGAESIHFAGFDGFSSEESNRPMQLFWNEFLALAQERGTDVIFVTPTSYDVPQESIFAILD